MLKENEKNIKNSWKNIIKSEINRADFDKMNSLIEIKDSKVFGHINNLVPELAKTLVAVDNSKNAMQNVMTSGLNVTSMVVGQYYMAQIDNKLISK